jgi:hypothetical protein
MCQLNYNADYSGPGVSAAVLLTPLLFWVGTKHMLLIIYRRFGTVHLFYVQEPGSPK